MVGGGRVGGDGGVGGAAANAAWRGTGGRAGGEVLLLLLPGEEYVRRVLPGEGLLAVPVSEVLTLTALPRRGRHRVGIGSGGGRRGCAEHS